MENKPEGTFWKTVEEKCKLISNDLTLVRIITEDDLTRAKNTLSALKNVTEDLRTEHKSTPYTAVHSSILGNQSDYHAHLQRIDFLAYVRLRILQSINKDPFLYSLVG